MNRTIVHSSELVNTPALKGVGGIVVEGIIDVLDIYQGDSYRWYKCKIDSNPILCDRIDHPFSHIDSSGEKMYSIHKIIPKVFDPMVLRYKSTSLNLIIRN